MNIKLELPVPPQAPQPEVKSVVLTTTPKGGSFLPNLVCGIIGVVFGLLLSGSSFFRHDEGRQERDEKHQVQPDEDKEQSPVPKLANAWLIIIEESSQRTPQVARILADSKYFDSLGSRKIKWRLYDKDAKQAESFVAAAEKVGYPALLILTNEPGSTKSTLVAAKPCPPTTDSIDEFVRKVTGL